MENLQINNTNSLRAQYSTSVVLPDKSFF